jgi:hypothetical protein
MCATLTDIMNGNWKFLFFFFLFKRDNSVKTSGPNPNSNLTCAFLWRTYTCNLNLINTSKQKSESVNLKFHFFSKFKRSNSVKNHWTITKFELDLRILMSNLHMQFEPYTYIQTKVREPKLKSISRRITLSKIIRPWPNSNLTCIILWCIYIKKWIKCVQPFKR